MGSSVVPAPMILSIQRETLPRGRAFSRKFPSPSPRRSSIRSSGGQARLTLIYWPDTVFQRYQPIKRPHLDEIAEVIDRFLMAVSCTPSVSPERNVARATIAVNIGRQPNATKLETDKEGVQRGIITDPLGYPALDGGRCDLLGAASWLYL